MSFNPKLILLDFIYDIYLYFILKHEKLDTIFLYE